MPCACITLTSIESGENDALVESLIRQSEAFLATIPADAWITEEPQRFRPQLETPEPEHEGEPERGARRRPTAWRVSACRDAAHKFTADFLADRAGSGSDQTQAEVLPELLRTAIVDLAGISAEWRLYGRDMDEFEFDGIFYDSPDYRAALAHAVAVLGEQQEAEAFLEFAKLRARKLLALPDVWRDVERLCERKHARCMDPRSVGVQTGA